MTDIIAPRLLFNSQLFSGGSMTNLLRTKKLPYFGVIKTVVVMWLAKKVPVNLLSPPKAYFLLVTWRKLVAASCSSVAYGTNQLFKKTTTNYWTQRKQQGCFFLGTWDPHHCIDAAG